LGLYHIAVGRGTQNYTCDLSNATAMPVQIGAWAALFNVSCLAATYPDLLNTMSTVALKFPIPTSDNAAAPANAYLSGHHWFEDTTTPYFNLQTEEHNFGSAALASANKTAAPVPAKDVPWLKLEAKDPASCNFTEVYRVNTAGGLAPKTCTGQAASFQVEYAAEYWMYR